MEDNLKVPQLKRWPRDAEPYGEGVLGQAEEGLAAHADSVVHQPDCLTQCAHFQGNDFCGPFASAGPRAEEGALRVSQKIR
jgi:hypothetical protein